MINFLKNWFRKLPTEVGSVAQKEAIKHLLSGATNFARKAVAWIASAVFLIFVFPNVPREPSGQPDTQALLHMLWDRLAMAISWIVAHAWQLAAYFVFATVFITLILVGGKYVASAWKKSKFRRALIRRTGISAYWSHANHKNKHTGHECAKWERLREHIRDEQAILIWGANGKDTFARSDAPLHDTISSFASGREVRVMLMNPDGNAALDGRAEGLNITPKDYRAEIDYSLTQLAKWKSEGRNIHVRLYDSAPGWKMILTNRIAWVQYYQASQHVADTPVYEFYSNRTGLFSWFYGEFHRAWEACGADVDLSQYWA